MEEKSPEEIKQAVLNRYSSHARKRLAELEQAAAPSACCGAPPAPVSETSSCCSAPATEADRNVVDALYGREDLAELPEDVLTSLGCGNPMAIAGLREGEAVLDLGSGGGLDCFLAAKRVGAGGSVVGLDMSGDMIQLARRNAQRIGIENVQFRLGEMEAMPFADGSFDVIVSNCVINLSPDKDAVFREAYRVLKPGGRLRASDIVWTREPSAAERNDLASWTSCVAGALTEADYAAKLRAAGFQDVRVEAKDGTPVGNLYSANVSAEKKA